MTTSRPLFNPLTRHGADMALGRIPLKKIGFRHVH